MVTHRLEVVHPVVEEGLVWRGPGRLEEERADVSAVDRAVVGERCVADSGQGREEVHRRGQLRGGPTGRDATWPAGDAGHPHPAFPSGALGASQLRVAPAAVTAEGPFVASEVDAAAYRKGVV